jgi:hypothetical protein
VTISVPSGPSAWSWLLVPTLLSILSLVLIARRAPRPPERGTLAPPPPVAGIAASSRRALLTQRSLDVAGVVLDLHRDTPLAGADVTLTESSGATRHVRTRDDGTFSLTEVAPGTWRMKVRHRGYGEESSELTLPHRGEWIDFTVRLESLRDRAVAPFRRVALLLLPSARLWPVLTNREVAERSRGRASERLDAFSDAVDRAAYGPEGPSEEEVARIEREATDVLRDA